MPTCVPSHAKYCGSRPHQGSTEFLNSISWQAKKMKEPMNKYVQM